MAGRPKANLELTEVQRQEFERIVRTGTAENRMVFRARLILECATGADNVQVAKHLGTTEQTVTLWRGGFLREGVGGVWDFLPRRRARTNKTTTKGRKITCTIPLHRRTSPP